MEDIHGDKEQVERERSLRAFKAGHVQVSAAAGSLRSRSAVHRGDSFWRGIVAPVGTVLSLVFAFTFQPLFLRLHPTQITKAPTYIMAMRAAP